MNQFFEPKLIEALKDQPTPFYYYDLDVLEHTLKAIQKAVGDSPFHVHYAIKANANAEILKKIKAYGLGIDCVSGEEVAAALKHGFTVDQIAFAGVGKRDDEIELGINAGIFTFNVESLEELKVINQIAEELDSEVNVALRFNPNVNAKTHEYITTGLDENKFGINEWEVDALFELLPQLRRLNIRGLHFHIGSQITDLSVYKNLCNRVNEFQRIFRERGYQLDHVNVGGGLGVNYDDPDAELIPDFNSFFNLFREFVFLYPRQTLHFELGRAVVAQCAALITKVLYIKKGLKKNFLILDAGMTELIRPALYQSYHKIQNLSRPTQAEKESYDVVGPVCESSDCFGKAVQLPVSSRGDLYAIRSTGAYGEVMRSSYNLRKAAKTLYKNELT